MIQEKTAPLKAGILASGIFACLHLQSRKTSSPDKFAALPCIRNRSSHLIVKQYFIQIIRTMESVNKIEILGNVGNIRIQEAGESRAIHLSVVTNRMARNKNGENYVEATWHHVEAWEGQQNIVDFSKITKGCWVRATGRLKNNKYTGSDKIERYTMDIVASRLEVVEDKD